MFATMKKFFREFCDKVISLHPSIRFIGIADQHGLILATSERKNLRPLLNNEETRQYRNYGEQHVSILELDGKRSSVKLTILVLITINYLDYLSYYR